MADTSALTPYKEKVKVFRADKTGKIESLGKPLTASDIVEVVNSLPKALELGMPKEGVQHLVARLGVEGREDFGNNGGITMDNPKVKALYNKAIDAGLPDKAASYAAMVLEKKQIADANHISYDEAWNGTGVSKSTGLSGKDYAATMKANYPLEDAPQNVDMKTMLDRAVADNLTPQERILQLRDNGKLLGALLGTDQPIVASTRNMTGETYSSKDLENAYVEAATGVKPKVDTVNAKGNIVEKPVEGLGNASLNQRIGIGSGTLQAAPPTTVLDTITSYVNQLFNF